MKKSLIFLVTISIIWILSGCSGEIDKAKTHTKGGILYKFNSDVPYSGIVIDYYKGATQKIKSREEFLNGLPNGPFTEYYENGKIKSAFNYFHGEITGEYETWFENGQLETHAVFDSNKVYNKIENWKENGDQAETKYGLNKLSLPLSEVLSFINKSALGILDYWGFPAQNEEKTNSLSIKYNFYDHLNSPRAVLSFNYVHENNNLIPAGISIVYYNSAQQGLYEINEDMNDSLAHFGFRKSGENKWISDKLVVNSMNIFENIMFVITLRNSK